MAYCIVVTQPRYHHSTDALIESSSAVWEDLGTFETWQYATYLASKLTDQCDDDDWSIVARPTDDPFDCRRTAGCGIRAALDPRSGVCAGRFGLHHQRPIEVDDELPF